MEDKTDEHIRVYFPSLKLWGKTDEHLRHVI